MFFLAGLSGKMFKTKTLALFQDVLANLNVAPLLPKDFRCPSSLAPFQAQASQSFVTVFTPFCLFCGSTGSHQTTGSPKSNDFGRLFQAVSSELFRWQLVTNNPGKSVKPMISQWLQPKRSKSLTWHSMSHPDWFSFQDPYKSFYSLPLCSIFPYIQQITTGPLVTAQFKHMIQSGSYPQVGILNKKQNLWNRPYNSCFKLVLRWF